MAQSIKWQAPGNGKGFDSYLGDSSKMNNRTIGIMHYIKEHSVKNGYVSEALFTADIKEYLEDKYGAAVNQSLDTHFYKPALFYGFILRDTNYNLSLSIEGNLFINAYDAKDFIQCKKIIINQLDNTSYPNEATLRVKELQLFPFRILFKLLLEKTRLSNQFIKEELVYIQKLEDINLLHSFKGYDKFNTWVINSLVDLEILNLDNGYIYINKSIYTHLESLYKNADYSDMFFEHSLRDTNRSIAKKRVKRDASLIDTAKKRDNYSCVLNKNHTTFVSGTRPYVEGHHVIPMYQQKNYDFLLDDIENIASLCPNCHREIHLSDDKKEILSKLYLYQKKYMTEKDISVRDFFKMY